MRIIEYALFDHPVAYVNAFSAQNTMVGIEPDFGAAFIHRVVGLNFREPFYAQGYFSFFGDFLQSTPSVPFADFAIEPMNGHEHLKAGPNQPVNRIGSRLNDHAVFDSRRATCNRAFVSFNFHITKPAGCRRRFEPFNCAEAWNEYPLC